MSWLESLRQYTTVVSDTGDLDAIARLHPQDATTNPSLLLKAARDPRYEHLVASALEFAGRSGGDRMAQAERFLDKLFVDFGIEILKLIPGRVSTEVDARLSFDTRRMVDKARALMTLYEQAGIARERVLIKVTATWEGIRAAKQLEKEGIHTNLTLLFGFAQAVACADAKVSVISPFVGRIYDWYLKSKGVTELPREDDPGVASATRIYNYYKRFGYRTEIMGASFRKLDQVLDLAGCDLLTISPQLLDELASHEGTIERKLSPELAKKMKIDRVRLDEASFRWLHNQDPAAVEKLSEGIRQFDRDARQLESFAQDLIGQSRAA